VGTLTWGQCNGLPSNPCPDCHTGSHAPLFLSDDAIKEWKLFTPSRSGRHPGPTNQDLLAFAPCWDRVTSLLLPRSWNK
jgi:hypothetical protein